MKPNSYRAQLLFYWPMWSKIIIFHAAITCGDIPDPENGQIIHVPDTHAPFEFGNEARYTCYVDGENRIGYGLTGGNHTRTCAGDGSSPVGYWTGIAPTCERELDHVVIDVLIMNGVHDSAWVQLFSVD